MFVSALKIHKDGSFPMFVGLQMFPLSCHMFTDWCSQIHDALEKDIYSYDWTLCLVTVARVIVLVWAE